MIKRRGGLHGLVYGSERSPLRPTSEWKAGNNAIPGSQQGRTLPSQGRREHRTVASDYILVQLSQTLAVDTESRKWRERDALWVMSGTGLWGEMSNFRVQRIQYAGQCHIDARTG